jgi:hypothetical protein
LTLRTPRSDVTTYTTVVAYGRASFGMRLFNDSSSTEPSPPMTAFPLSTQAGGGSKTMGLTNTVFEVEGILKIDVTYHSDSI